VCFAIECKGSCPDNIRGNPHLQTHSLSTFAVITFPLLFRMGFHAVGNLVDRRQTTVCILSVRQFDQFFQSPGPLFAYLGSLLNLIAIPDYSSSSIAYWHDRCSLTVGPRSDLACPCLGFSQPYGCSSPIKSFSIGLHSLGKSRTFFLQVPQTLSPSARIAIVPRT